MRLIVTGALCLTLAACTDEQNVGNTYTLRASRWTARIGLTGPGTLRADHVALDPAGDVVAAGRLTGTADFGGTSMTTSLQAVAFWLGKRSGADGSPLWTTLLGGAEQQGFWLSGVATDASGSVIVAGDFGGTQPFGDGSIATTTANAYVGKFAGDGHLQWTATLDLGFESSAHAFALAVGPEGRIYITGAFVGTLRAPDRLLATSSASNCGFTGYDCFVAAFEPDGTLRWARQIPVSGRLQVASDGSLMMVSAVGTSRTFAGTALDLTKVPNQFAAKISSDGEVLWVRTFGEVGVRYGALRFAMDDHDRIAATSYVDSADASPTIVQTMLDASARPLWPASPPIGGLTELAIATNGHAVLTAGHVAGAIVDLGSGEQVGSMYLAARDDDGNVVDSRVFGDPSTGLGDGFNSLAMAADGAVAFAASIDEPVDFGSGAMAGPPLAGMTDTVAVVGVLGGEP